MPFKYKLQLLIMPLLVIPVLIISIIFINNTSSSISKLQFDTMDFKLGVLKEQCDSEHSILARLNLETSVFYVDSAQKKVISEISKLEIPGGFIYIFDSSGEVIRSPESIEETFSELDHMQIILESGELESESPITYSQNNLQWISLNKYFEPWDWFIVAVAQEDIIYGGIYDSIKLAIISGIVAILLAYLFLFIISKSVSRPIEELISGVEKLSHGKFDTQVYIKTKGEFSSLATSFNNMANQLNDSFKMIHSQMDEIREVSNDLKSSEELFKATFNQAFQLIGLLDTHGMFIKANDTGLAFVNSKKEDIIGKPIWETPFWSSSTREVSTIKKLINGALEGEFMRMETVYKNRVNLDFSMKPIFNAENEVVMIIVEARDITDLKSTENELKKLNEELENRVRLRTSELVETNEYLEESIATLEETQSELINTKDELENSLINLTDTQSQLIESEKLASLGAVVAGISHEINTPMGIAVTLTSHINREVGELEKLFNENKLNKNSLVAFIKSTSEETELALRNLKHASELISGFKMIAVDQSSHERRIFNVKNYLYEILNTIYPRIKRTLHVIKIQCDEDIEMDSFPGAIFQILNNLVMNSLIHGFENIEKGDILIKVEVIDDVLILEYKDNGKGINPEDKQKIFDPFFTTARGSGGSGLGLHIVYNLVRTVLAGEIQCESKVGEGVRFTLKLPLSAYDISKGDFEI